MRTRLFTLTVLLIALVVSCGIPDSGGVSRIPDKDTGGLSDTLPTTSTSTTPPTTIETTTTIESEPSTTIANEDVTLYFISGGQLKSYPASLVKGAGPNQVMFKLQAGPTETDGLGAGLRSAVPPPSSPITVSEDGSGIATVDLPPTFYDQIPPEDQLLVIGQIVLTLTDIAGIGQVMFRQNGQPVGVNRGSGLSDPSQPLARRDYDSLTNTPVTTTSIAAPTTVA
jgi:spore germination protein GerM